MLLHLCCRVFAASSAAILDPTLACPGCSDSALHPHPAHLDYLDDLWWFMMLWSMQTTDNVTRVGLKVTATCGRHRLLNSYHWPMGWLGSRLQGTDPASNSVASFWWVSLHSMSYSVPNSCQKKRKEKTAGSRKHYLNVMSKLQNQIHWKLYWIAT